MAMYLEAFDKQSHHLVRDYPLARLSLDELKQILGVDPLAEQYGADVPLDLLPKIVAHVNEPFQFDESCIYQVDFYCQ